jgi:hypothetical protein
VLIGVWQLATAAAPSAFETLQQRVTRLLETWRTETAHLSSSTERNAHPAYQEIINIGMAGLPFLLRDLEKTRDGHLSKALSAITGVHPVPPESRGKIAQVAEAWLRWAKDNDLRG